MLLQPVDGGEQYHCCVAPQTSLHAICTQLSPGSTPPLILQAPKLQTDVQAPFTGTCLTSTGMVLPCAHMLWSFPCLQGMSEEAVRQTRSQKRALERDALPQLTEPSSSDSESKKPKLDPSEPTEETQTEPETHPAAPGDDLSRTRDTPKHEEDDSGDDMDKEGEGRGHPPLPSGSPSAARPATDDEEPPQRREAGEPSSDNRTDCDGKVGQVKAEPGADARSCPPAAETKAGGGAMAGGEVKATIKVEVQTGEQPVDMSTSRR